MFRAMLIDVALGRQSDLVHLADDEGPRIGEVRVALDLVGELVSVMIRAHSHRTLGSVTYTIFLDTLPDMVRFKHERHRLGSKPHLGPRLVDLALAIWVDHFIEKCV